MRAPVIILSFFWVRVIGRAQIRGPRPEGALYRVKPSACAAVAASLRRL